jgi:hypothetical protein
MARMVISLKNADQNPAFVWEFWSADRQFELIVETEEDDPFSTDRCSKPERFLPVNFKAPLSFVPIISSKPTRADEM